MVSMTTHTCFLIDQSMTPDALFLEWSLPGPFKGSMVEIFVWFVLTHFSLEIDLRSQSPRSSSKSLSRYSPEDTKTYTKPHTKPHQVFQLHIFPHICYTLVSKSFRWFLTAGILIRPIATVIGAVTDQPLLHAVPTFTPQHPCWTAFSRRWCCKCEETH